MTSKDDYTISPAAKDLNESLSCARQCSERRRRSHTLWLRALHGLCDAAGAARAMTAVRRQQVNARNMPLFYCQINGHKCLTAWASLIFMAWLWGGAAVAAGLSADTPLPQPTGPVLLTVGGAISNTNGDGVAEFDRAMLEALPQVHIDTHTSVTDGVHVFGGFLIRDLLAVVGAQGDTVVAKALNDYVIDFPVNAFDEFDIIAAHTMDGRPLVPSRKGPLWIVYPRDDFPELQDIRYDARWVWQLYRIEVERRAQ